MMTDMPIKIESDGNRITVSGSEPDVELTVSLIRGFIDYINPVKNSGWTGVKLTGGKYTTLEDEIAASYHGEQNDD